MVVRSDAELDNAEVNAMDSKPEIVRHKPCISCIFRHGAFGSVPYKSLGSNMIAYNFSVDIGPYRENEKLPFQNPKIFPA